MSNIEMSPDVKIIYHYGHFSFYLSCPVCHEKFETHNDHFLKELICPYCRSMQELQIPQTIHQISA